MITSVKDYVRYSRRSAEKLALDPRIHLLIGYGKWALAGLCFSAASLRSSMQPLALGLLCATGGPPAALTAIGGMVGYWLFWGRAGLQGIFWMLAGLPCAVLLGEKRIARDTPLLLPAIATLIVSAGGVIWQLALGDTTSIPIYLLRVGLAGGTAHLFRLTREKNDPVLRWLSAGLTVLALAQIVPIPYLGLGFLAGGMLGAWGAFPAGMVAGLALDLAEVTRVPMAAVLCLSYLVRLIPWGSRIPMMLAPGSVYMITCMLLNIWDIRPLPGLLLGGVLGQFLPQTEKGEYRRGETGIAQVRLELASGVMAQMEQLIVETPAPTIDEDSLILKAAERACSTCPCRKGCKERQQLPGMPVNLLHRPLLEGTDLPIICKKSGRVLSELRRSQEQMRSLRGNREQLKEYRTALQQQYQFLSGFLQELSDDLPRKIHRNQPRYQAQVSVFGNRPEAENGDRVVKFAGTGCNYYVLLCDGMGTGLGAVDEGKTAISLLKRLLTAGFPASHALRTLNSLCALRGRAGAATADLAEISLDTGRTTIYKWGAAPSYLLTPNGCEKIGTAGPPPGLDIADGRETVERLSLRRGETLLMLSDGAGGEDALRSWVLVPGETPGELAARILRTGETENADDATVAVIQLSDAFLPS